MQAKASDLHDNISTKSVWPVQQEILKFWVIVADTLIVRPSMSEDKI